MDVGARRQITRPGGAERVARPWRERATDRQPTVLEAASHAGFFEWQRERSSREVAETLDVAPPTDHQHLRTAEQKLLATRFDGRPAPTESDYRRTPSSRPGDALLVDTRPPIGPPDETAGPAD